MYRLLLLLCLAGCALASSLANDCNGLNTADCIPPLKPKCAKCAHNDLIFVLDQSQSILASNQYPKIIQFVIDVLSTVNATAGVQQTPYGANLGMDGNHVGFILFNNTVNGHAPLWQFLNGNGPQQMLTEIKAWLSDPAYAITGGLSNICLALQTAISDFKAYKRDVPRTVVLITDGAPNTITGDCTASALADIAGQLRIELNVQVLVVAVNGINGGPQSPDYQTLAAIASNSTSNHSVPLLWNLSEQFNRSLLTVRDALTSNMGCCDCYADVDFVLELSEATEGSNFEPVFNDFINFATTANIGSINSTKNTLGLTLFAKSGQNALCPCGNGLCAQSNSVQCSDVPCIEQYFSRECPAVFGNSTVCNLKGSLSAGHTSLRIGLNVAVLSMTNCARDYAPKVAVVLASGACETEADVLCGQPEPFNGAITGFQKAYPMRYIIGIGDSTHTNWTNLNTLAGNTDVDGLSGGLLNNANNTKAAIQSAMFTIPENVCRYISDQPGCNNPKCPTQNTLMSALRKKRM